MTEGAPVRRLAPRDRRTPVLVRTGQCTVGNCYCCPLASANGAIVKTHGQQQGGCPQRHPAEDRKCSPPYPKDPPQCPEWRQLTQDPPIPPIGFRAPRYELCIECGRVTARRWTNPNGQLLPWCAGLFPPPTKR